MKTTLRHCFILVLVCTFAGQQRATAQALAQRTSARWQQNPASPPTDSFQDSAIQPQAGAALDPREFRYSRSLPEAPAGFTALLLDTAALAHSRSDLADLRIIDADNHQIPYLLEKLPETFKQELSWMREQTAASGTRSHYRLELPFENLPVSILVLTTNERTFERMVSVELQKTATDPRAEPTMETVATAAWRHSDPENAAPPLLLELPSLAGTKSATVIIDEGDNHPLALEKPYLELPLYRLRFFYPAKGILTLLYGNSALSAPRYDLALLGPRLADRSSRELTLTPENQTPESSYGAAIQARVFWAALIIAVVAVSALLFRLLRSGKAADRRESP